MTNDILAKIEREYAYIRQKNADKLEKRLNIAENNEDFRSSRKAIKVLDFEIAKAEQFLNDEALAEKLRSEKKSEEAKLSAALKKLKMTEADFSPSYDCDKCKDIGFISGRPCDCFKEKYKRYTFNELGISPVPDLTFADDTVQKPEKLVKIYSTMKKYVEKFPSAKTRNFLFVGKTGCGKTHLASIVCGELYKKGFNCVFLTATEANQLFLRMHTTKLSERPDYMGILISCDFLVIDDLGTENIYNNVTAEYFLTLISERLAKKKHTVITTNLTSNEIMRRYNERFFSRVTEKRSSAQIIFEDVNFRA